MKYLLRQTLSTALLSLHLIYHQKELGKVQPISNEKLLEQEEWLWELDTSLLAQLPISCPTFHVGVFEHAPTLYSRLLPLANESFTSLCHSFDPALNQATLHKHAGNKGGRSSAFIYFTYDKRLILKTLTKAELAVMQGNTLTLLQYYESKKGEKSLLAKIVGLFTLHIRDKSRLHAAVVENVFRDAKNVQVVFDLKGSRVHRETLAAGVIPRSLTDFPPGQVYKDLDFERVARKPEVQEWSRAVKQLRRDTKVLRTVGVIDYSLLLGVLPHTHSPSPRLLSCGSLSLVLGLIDYLQLYNLRKRLEHSYKSLISSPRFISVSHPLAYQSRFLAFIKDMFPCKELDL